ncbi:zinc-finger domain-containing protein [Thiocapsa bogorovii]|uniref:zinc-finger domain-containing protein n=1 Tax=Thiocapsa bogorovii TaxID=521689 RepID=UPI001E652063|nr:zinc-finger domain-containing protein [Thiocapsa bogorovii]UHD18386.1 zinc-finger domain-containing protein [Thiocapsa bogorovii]
MSNAAVETRTEHELIEVSHKDLPLSCPLPGAPVWNMHPRVYLPIEDEPNHEATCPYCGARYRLV